jgi:hypothetical protein
MGQIFAGYLGTRQIVCVEQLFMQAGMALGWARDRFAERAGVSTRTWLRFCGALAPGGRGCLGAVIFEPARHGPAVARAAAAADRLLIRVSASTSDAGPARRQRCATESRNAQVSGPARREQVIDVAVGICGCVVEITGNDEIERCSTTGPSPSGVAKSRARSVSAALMVSGWRMA